MSSSPPGFTFALSPTQQPAAIQTFTQVVAQEDIIILTVLSRKSPPTLGKPTSASNLVLFLVW